MRYRSCLKTVNECTVCMHTYSAIKVIHMHETHYNGVPHTYIHTYPLLPVHCIAGFSTVCRWAGKRFISPWTKMGFPPLVKPLLSVYASTEDSPSIFLKVHICAA